MNRIAVILLSILTSWAEIHAHDGSHDGDNTKGQARQELQTQTHILISTEAQAGETPASTETEQTPVNKPPADGVRVTVLGYHDFSTTKKATEMLISTDKFRKQMEAIRELGLNVISLETFIDWKLGRKKLSDKSVLITIDDGWKSVYTDAYPILKEFGYPFTVFLYTNYIDGGGSALTTPMIKEMMQNGCSIGCHSVSHPYPSTIRAQQKKGPESFSTFLEKEMAGSKKSLESQFKRDVTSYAYPGGFVTEEMLPVASEAGYECLFTVLPGKVTRNLPDNKLPRYIILGTHDYIFRNATSFKATSTSSATHGAIVQSTDHPVTPEPGKLATTRQPHISADLSKIENIDPDSLVMRVAGFGKVPAQFDTVTQAFSWKTNRRLRSRTCKVSVQWKLIDQSKYQKPMTWTFRVNREAAYQAK